MTSNVRKFANDSQVHFVPFNDTADEVRRAIMVRHAFNIRIIAG